MNNQYPVTSQVLLKEIDLLKSKITELEISELNSNALLENTSSHIILLDTDYTIQFINHTVPDLTKDQVVGKSVLNFVPFDYQQIAINCFERVLKSGSPDGYETKYITTNGISEYFDVQISPVLDKKQKVTGLISSSNNITERKKAEQEIQYSNSILESILNSPDNIIMFALDTGYNYIGFNHAHVKEMKSIYGVDIELKKNILLYMPNTDDQHKAEINYKRVLKGERFVNIEEYGTEDSRFWYELYFNPIVDKSKLITGFTVFVSNITEKKLMEESLLKSKKMFSSFITSATDGIVIYDKDLNLIDINDSAIEIFPEGTIKENLIGKNILKLVPEVKVSGRFDKYLNVIKTGKSLILDDIIAGDKFGDRHLTIKAFKVEDGLGIIFTDVSERIKTNESLKNYSRIFEDSLNEIYLFKSNTYKFIQVNIAAQKNLGYTMDEFLEMTPLDFKPEFTQKSFIKLVEPLRNGKKDKIIFETVHQRKDQSLYDVEVHLQLLDFENKNIFAAIILDITNRKKAEKALEIQRKKLYNVIEGTNAGTWEWNIITGELLLNKRWAGIIGYSLKELEPVSINTWIDNVHPDDLKNTNAQLQELFNKKTDYYDVEFRQPHKNGSWVWVNARGKVIEWTDDGKPVRMSGTHINITTRKKIQQELVGHRQHLESLVEEKTSELRKKNEKLDNAMKVFVGREQRIKDLENRIRTFEKSNSL